ncbi:MAG: pyridoxal-phosphate-dependent aminotransferase family protein [Anaerolineae bacterium]
MPLKSQLRIPGPTPLPPEVLQALSRPMINHRSPEFHQLLFALEERVQKVIGTGNDVLFLTASGTGGLEAAVANAITAGDRVLSVCIGHFGERFAEIAEVFGAKVDYLRFAPGTAADPVLLAQQLTRERYEAVLVTHSETSTGVLNDLPAISRALDSAPYRPLLLVDGVSSLAAVPLSLADRECDIVVTASQKAWMAPPGLAMLVVSERAWAKIEACRSPRVYLDLVAARRYARRGETPWTPAISVLYGLDAALDLILAEGLASVFARHQLLARRFRAGLRDMGLTTLAREECASPTVTAVPLPSGVPAERLLEELRRQHGVEAAGGQGELKGRVLRFGHMGYIGEEDVDYLLMAISDVLARVAMTGSELHGQGIRS